METINDPNRLNQLIEDLHVKDHFGAELPYFLLLHYHPGELLTTPFSPNKYLQFIAEGDLLLYDMPDENQTIVLQTNYNDVNLIGEMELLDAYFEPFFVEAASDVYTLAIYLASYRDRLLNDPVFLRFICMTLSNKLSGAVRSTSSEPLKSRVTRSLRHAEPGTQFGDISSIAIRLGVSSRQLLRVLKALCDEGILEHEKKGQYRILRKP